MNTEVSKIIQSWGFTPYLRLSVTDNCNFSCPFCYGEGSERGVHGSLLKVRDYRNLSNLFFSLGIDKVKFTGGEPTLRPDLEDIVLVFRRAGFTELSLTSNGFLLDPERLVRLHRSGLNRINVSLGSLRPEAYSQICGVEGDSLSRVLRNLRYASRLFAKSTKVNAIFIPGINFPDDVIPLVEFCRDIGATLSVLSLLDQSGEEYKSDRLLSLQVFDLLVRRFEVEDVVKYQKRVGVATIIYLRRGGIVELDDFRQKEAIRGKENAYCKTCSVYDTCIEGPYAFRITAAGAFRPCLIRQDNEIPFRQLLGYCELV